MITRCTSKTWVDYPHYGGRGIKVCKRWLGKHGFDNFLVDMGRRPSKKHSLDRRDNDGNYEPQNCRWATQSEQMQNTRRNTGEPSFGEPTPRSHPFQLRIRPSEFAAWKLAAQRDDLSIASWARRILNRAAVPVPRPIPPIVSGDQTELALENGKTRRAP